MLAVPRALTGAVGVVAAGIKWEAPLCSGGLLTAGVKTVSRSIRSVSDFTDRPFTSASAKRRTEPSSHEISRRHPGRLNFGWPRADYPVNTGLLMPRTDRMSVSDVGFSR